ncbi:winged helix DNA-binding domain-containing protein [Vitreoscilla massiliensis]|uniref:Winged helix DNA-binding domain-containing protein n=1 Tax=Vitreoscilla massiliensis TaxID=1689272 RepID=A0ABY4E6T2_9NEIS|nr:crosslink repair DNA glycosylase YcaQ family protein [Vitreoscilla massiliensis]UOO91033.1 winged helix DNA-binding domain-containing protein [Vitreoscilla massiliensis]
MNTFLRRMATAQQGLAAETRFAAGSVGSLQALQHLGYVQIDTISVVERAHHHVLWSRVPEYELGHLNQLVHEQHAFEYWYHAAAYLPMRDYRYALLQMEEVRAGNSRYFNRGDAHLMREIVARVQDEGSIRLRHIAKNPQDQSGGWWNTGPARRSVEQLFMQGDLMVCERNGMEKVYALRETCLPTGLDVSTPTLAEYADYVFATTLRAHGVFTWKQLLHLKTGNALRVAMREVVRQQLEAGKIVAQQLASGDEVYVDVALLSQEAPVASGLKILSPFDNVLIHRERLSALFGFDYRIECYVPAAKRVFGYFCLPLLYGETMVGRMDCKAHRRSKTLQVLSVHWQESVPEREHLLAALRSELPRFAAFNQCHDIDATVLDRG